MKIKLKIIAVGFVLAGFLCLTGCSTAEGFGKDLEKGGQHLQKGASSK